MITTYRRSRSPNCVTFLFAMVIVLSSYLVWTGIIKWLTAGGSPESLATQQAQATLQTPTPTRAAFVIDIHPSPVPPCDYFFVNTKEASVRECPDLSCERRDILKYREEVCVYGVANDPAYDFSGEWYIIDFNPNGAFRDIGYMHNTVIDPLNPTPRPSKTFTPLPTITPTNTPTRPPTLPSPTAGTPTPLPTVTPVPSPTPTRPRESF